MRLRCPRAAAPTLELVVGHLDLAVAHRDRRRWRTARRLGRRVQQPSVARLPSALSSSERYDRGAGPIYAKGKDTPAARRFFRSNDLEPEKRIELIQGIERAGIREVRAAEPLWTKAKLVTLRPDGTGTVLITQCVDYTRLRWEDDNGRPVQGLKPKTLVTPLTVQMDKPDAKSQWLYANSQVKGKQSCVG